MFCLNILATTIDCFYNHDSDPCRIVCAELFLIEPSIGVCATQIPNEISRYMHTCIFFLFPLLHSMARIAQPQRFYQGLLCLHIAMFQLKHATFLLLVAAPDIRRDLYDLGYISIYFFGRARLQTGVVHDDSYSQLRRWTRRWSCLSVRFFCSLELPLSFSTHPYLRISLLWRTVTRALVTIRLRLLCTALPHLVIFGWHQYVCELLLAMWSMGE